MSYLRQSRSLLCLCSLTVAVGADLASQQVWNIQTIDPDTAPPRRLGHCSAFDIARGETVVFGGLLRQVTYRDTWTWDGAAWREHRVANFPAGRFRAAMAYDAARNETVLFSGVHLGTNTYRPDTWVWDGTRWAQRTPATSPPPRYGHAMAFDAARNVVVMFGGRTASQFATADHWEWDGSTWTQRTLANAPPARFYHAMSYDRDRQRLVMLGGRMPIGDRSDTWEWDGSEWHLMNPVFRPPGIELHAMTYDPVARVTVLAGGAKNFSGDHRGTYLWDGSNWTEHTQANPMPFAVYPTSAYDASRARIVLFGGQQEAFETNDTWEWGPRAPASYVAYGHGCRGTAGVPSLQPAAGQRPVLGTTLVLDVGNLPANAAASVFVGFQNDRFGNGLTELPLDLSVIGMSLCLLYTDLNIGYPVTHSGGAGTAQIRLPNVNDLVGRSIFNQAAVLDPGGNLLGVTLSNPGWGRLGLQ